MGNLRVYPKQYVFVLQGQKDLKPSRYWNETCVLTVQDHTLYSLAEFCLGMPREVDIVTFNRYLGIHPYRMLENVSKYDGAGKRTEPDIEATITALVTFETIPNREQRALEDLMVKVQQVIDSYFYWSKIGLSLQHIGCSSCS